MTCINESIHWHLNEKLCVAGFAGEYDVPLFQSNHISLLGHMYNYSLTRNTKIDCPKTSMTKASFVFDIVMTVPPFRLPNDCKIRSLNWYQTLATSEAAILQPFTSPRHYKQHLQEPQFPKYFASVYSHFGCPGKTTHSHCILNQMKQERGFKTHQNMITHI